VLKHGNADDETRQPRGASKENEERKPRRLALLDRMTPSINYFHTNVNEAHCAKGAIHNG
jgi:hypothetical protein